MKPLTLLKTVGMTVLGLLILFNPGRNLRAMEGKIRFEKGIEGLPSQMEGNMVRDSDGFLWFCYYGGVGRYDGYEVRYYEPGPDSVSGPGPISVVADREGTLWILTKATDLTDMTRGRTHSHTTDMIRTMPTASAATFLSASVPTGSLLTGPAGF